MFIIFLSKLIQAYVVFIIYIVLAKTINYVSWYKGIGSMHAYCTRSTINCESQTLFVRIRHVKFRIPNFFILFCINGVCEVDIENSNLDSVPTHINHPENFADSVRICSL